ncbi:MAG: uroporphyrinogen-III C-methyltransferase [Deltaproteobacteria bacterium]|nr:MAG: uroporphyrinogen-III C-methyltransferase [Deltaproteobacteria bacterium]
MNATHAHRKGRVSLVGAGPGDPELLTLRAWRRIQDAETVCYDQLVGDPILGLIPNDARRIPVGKVGGGPSTSQDEIHRILAREALAGRRVVRLKGGDPFVFGRGGEEALFLARLGIPVEVVPGLSSAIAGPAAAAIPVTHRGLSTSVTIVTGAAARGADPALRESWAHLARAGGTLVVLMSLRRLQTILDTLTAAGLPANTPAAMVQAATLDDQRVVTGTAACLPQAVATAGLGSPALLVVGEVVRVRDQLHTLVGPLAFEQLGQNVASARGGHDAPGDAGDTPIHAHDARP